VTAGASPASTPDLEADRAFCRSILPGVSRTFALTIPLLPRTLEHPVMVAYLLCRVADTIEDSTSLEVERKRALLGHFRRCLEQGGPDAAPLRETFAEPANEEERLGREADTVLRAFRALPQAQRDAIRPWVQEMCDGMADFVSAYPPGEGRLRALVSLEELDRYCYYVAGTVGRLLTALFGLHDAGMDPSRQRRLEELAASFGLGLQLTNIIKDAAEDRGRGVSYVPRELWEKRGMDPDDLRRADRAGEAHAVLRALIARARAHLADALDYCTTLRRRQYRIRLFCLTSLYFAVKTLRLADRDPRLLSPEHKVKITRGAVYRTLAATYLLAPVNALVRAYFRLLSTTPIGA
jgi:farnesyl-diphosphate farnesyltransferase